MYHMVLVVSPRWDVRWFLPWLLCFFVVGWDVLACMWFCGRGSVVLEGELTIGGVTGVEIGGLSLLGRQFM